MANPDIHSRVDRHGEDITAISGTVVDILETVQQHSAILDRHSTVLDQHSATLAQHTATLAEHSRGLSELKGDMAEVRGTLAVHGQQLGEILTLLRQGR